MLKEFAIKHLFARMVERTQAIPLYYAFAGFYPFSGGRDKTGENKRIGRMNPF